MLSILILIFTLPLSNQLNIYCPLQASAFIINSLSSSTSYSTSPRYSVQYIHHSPSCIFSLLICLFCPLLSDLFCDFIVFPKKRCICSLILFPNLSTFFFDTSSS